MVTAVVAAVKATTGPCVPVGGPLAHSCSYHCDEAMAAVIAVAMHCVMAGDYVPSHLASMQNESERYLIAMEYNISKGT